VVLNGIWVRKNCDFSATTFQGKWVILYTEEPSGRAAFGLDIVAKIMDVGNGG